jgi:hypothetical protein
MMCRPAAEGVRHWYSHNRHAFFTGSPMSFAALQVCPESALTSTRVISPVPLQAAP